MQKIWLSSPRTALPYIKQYIDQRFVQSIGNIEKATLQISIGWLSVISSAIPLALKGILPLRIIPIGKIL